MKKLVVLVVTLLFSTLAYSAPRFEEGKHYEVVSKRISTKPVVTEMFSFYCPACYSFEFVVKGVEESLPPGVKFNKNHVDFLSYATQDMQQYLTRVMIVIDHLKLGHKVTDAIFDRIHKDKKKPKDEAEVRELLIANGVDAKKFDQAMKSFRFKGLANKAKKYQESLSNRNILKSIPLMIVNDKYVILRDELRSMEDYTELVKYLLTLK